MWILVHLLNQNIESKNSLCFSKKFASILIQTKLSPKHYTFWEKKTQYIETKLVTFIFRKLYSKSKEPRIWINKAARGSNSHGNRSLFTL